MDRNEEGRFIKGHTPFVYMRTEEQKRNASDKQKGEKGYWFGKKHREETKKKISEKNKGRKLTEETKRKIGLGNKGNLLSSEHRIKLRLSNLGRKQTEETRRKISESNKGKVAWSKGKHLSENHKLKVSLALSGRKLTEKHKRKVSLALKGKYIGKNNHRWKGEKAITPIIRRIRESIKYKKWRQDTFLRDNFTCQQCNQKGGFLEAHHYKKSFSQLLQEVGKNLPLFNIYDGAMIYSPMWDINNGQTLCKECHDKTKKGYKKKEIKDG